MFVCVFVRRHVHIGTIPLFGMSEDVKKETLKTVCSELRDERRVMSEGGVTLLSPVERIAEV